MRCFDRHAPANRGAGVSISSSEPFHCEDGRRPRSEHRNRGGIATRMKPRALAALDSRKQVGGFAHLQRNLD